MRPYGLTDPMLQAAAEGIASPDHLRWMQYADEELARLRDRCDLPTPSGYSCGLPNYDTAASSKARMIVAEVEQSMHGRFSPSDRVAVTEVIDKIITDAGLGDATGATT